jgi:two-component system response regulator HydG
MAHILVVDDNDTLREGVAAVAERLGHQVTEASSGDEAVRRLEALHVDLVITDLKMDGLDGLGVLKAVKARTPETVVMLMTAFGSIQSAVEAMRHGAFDYVEKPFSPEVLRVRIARALEVKQLRDDHRRLEAANELLSGARDREVRRTDGLFEGMVGESAAMRRVFQTIEKVGQSETPVHVFGESGTGKELVASALHQRSRRAQGPLIRVNCGAIPETLIESELFGHEKGAFTGAVKRKLGRFELADRGTLFLDEVGELSLSMQVKLLRALQEKEIDRVGGEHPIKVDVRVISASNRDLNREVEAGRFREDLYYRLHVVPVVVPPLRERTDDIVPLARHFVTKLRGRTNPDVARLEPDAEAALARYHYPGNVRELENIVEQALVFASAPAITLGDLPPQVTGARPKELDAFKLPQGELDLNAFLENLERQLILQAYEATAGVKTECARRLRIKPSALYYKLEKYGIGSVAGRELSGEATPAEEPASR